MDAPMYKAAITGIKKWMLFSLETASISGFLYPEFKRLLAKEQVNPSSFL